VVLEKDSVIVVAFGKNCIQLDFSKRSENAKETKLKYLKSDQKRVQVHIFVTYAKYLMNNIGPSVIIKSQDTDVSS